MRLWIFRTVTAIAAPLILLATLEAALRIVDYGHSGGFTVPCTVAGRAAYCDNNRFTWQFFPPGAFRLPYSFAIPAAKPPGTFRIFIVGESAAQGVPEPSYAFGRYLEVMLRERYPSVRFEVINASISSINSHVLLPITRDLARRQGDLFLFYIGNNEVVGPYGPGTTLTQQGSNLPLIRAGIALKSTRVGQLLSAGVLATQENGGIQEWRGMRMFLEKQVPADSPALGRMYGVFERNLRDIVEIAGRAGVPALISTVGVNLKDCAPFASLHRGGLSGTELKSWNEHYGKAQALAQSQRHAEAVEAYTAALSIDDRYADLHFRIGRSYWEIGEFAAARAHFESARELDVLRFRADARLNDLTRSVARAGGPQVELIDGEQVLAAASPQGVPGRELFHEHVHMTPHGNYVLARALFPHVVARMPASLRRQGGAEPLSEDEANRLLALTSFDRRRVAQKVFEWLNQPPFTHQSNHAEQIGALQAELAGEVDDRDRIDAAYRWAIAKAPEDRWLHVNYGVFLKDQDPASAVVQFERAVELLPDNHEAREMLADALIASDRLDEAIGQCEELLRRMPYHAPAYLTMAYALARKQDFEASVAAYERAIELHPTYAVAAYNQIGVIRLHQGRFQSAAASFEKAIALDTSGLRSAELRSNLNVALARMREDDATTPPPQVRSSAQLSDP